MADLAQLARPILARAADAMQEKRQRAAFGGGMGQAKARGAGQDGFGQGNGGGCGGRGLGPLPGAGDQRVDPGLKHRLGAFGNVRGAGTGGLDLGGPADRGAAAIAGRECQAGVVAAGPLDALKMGIGDDAV